jgi:hypothetical protein
MFSFQQVRFIFILTVVLLSSCRTSRIKTNTTPAPERKVEEMLSLLQKNTKTYNFYTAKINGDVDTDDFGIALNIGLWIQKDKYVFTTYKKLNIEAARAYITPDSIYIVNRLQRYYNAEELKSIWEMLRLEVPLTQLQDLIVGNQIIPAPEEVIGFIRLENDYDLSFEYDGNLVEYKIDGYTGLVKLVKIKNKDHGEVSAAYDDYRSTGGVKRPFKNTIVVKSPELNATVKLDLKEIIWEKDSKIQFSVPARYDRYGM